MSDDLVNWKIHLPIHVLEGHAIALEIANDRTLDLKAGFFARPHSGSLSTGFIVYRRDGTMASHTLSHTDTVTDYGYKVLVSVARNVVTSADDVVSTITIRNA